MLRQPLVEERVIRVQEVADRTVLAQHVLEEHRGLGFHRLAKLGRPFLELVRIRLHGVEVARLEPLAGEVRGEGGRARIGEHPIDLGFKHARVAQPAGFGERQQLLVRHRAPEEIADPRGELERRHLVHERGVARIGIALDAEQEIGRDQHRLDGELQVPARADCPFDFARSTNRRSESTSPRVGGRRYARRARSARIVSTQARPDSGSQERILFRVSFSVFDGNGPTKMIASRNLFFCRLYGVLAGQRLYEQIVDESARKT